MIISSVRFFSARKQSNARKTHLGPKSQKYLQKKSSKAAFEMAVQTKIAKKGVFNKRLRTFVVQYNFYFQAENSSMEGTTGKPVTEDAINNAVENIFKKYDQNHSNFIEFSQFRKLIEDLNLSPKLRVSLREITCIFKLLDVDGDGRVSREELIGALCEVKDISM